MGEAKRRMEQGLKACALRPGEQIPITQEMLDGAAPKKCECGCDLFIPAIRVYAISPFAPGNPVGKELTAQQPVLVCMECKAVLK